MKTLILTAEDADEMERIADLLYTHYIEHVPLAKIQYLQKLAEAIRNERVTNQV